ncbi:translation elongation factor 2 (EF-2/EF-G) [Pseudonocardia thermophila]|jgi:Translation elongation factors (GTPases)|uniref:Translation elongation factor 2 (EF-2/EF-G) n=1 Tax=Pseudonocardia thermophila TaxID=1848 RepID=A0A1M6Z3W6_PSETH|nr:elongation factor G-like protein EF-G2 [Pseudonocardia thermophila]SHL25075.1 translation elongation factor 2 (EF-2/EF-G) [Pseudonocardia thermophila]
MAGRAATGSRRGAVLGRAVTDPSRIRNVALVGPSGAGKTTLIEALLVHTGVLSRAGTIADGTTVCDHDPAAVRQHRSVALAVAPITHDELRINLIDTPGYGDFVGELRAGLRAADAALFVVPADAASAGGIDPVTVGQWAECARVGMPRAVVIARCDHQRADIEATTAACQEAFGAGVAPLYLPLFDGGSLTGLYGLISRTPADRAPAHADDARAALVEGIIEQSEDEALMERYLAGEEIDQRTLIADLETAVVRGGFHPVIPVCASSGVGMDALLEVIAGGFPSPLERPLPKVTGIDGSPRPQLTADPNGPLAAEVVHTSADAYVGRVSLIRVFSGTLRPDTAIHVSGHHARIPEQRAGEALPEGHDEDERIAHVYTASGAELTEVDACVAGDICALTKLAGAETGDTVSAASDPLLLSCWDLPEPLFPVAVVPATRGGEDALVKALSRVVAADPALRMERNAETRQTVLWTMGEAHADVVLSRLRAAGAEVATEDVRVPLRVTLREPGRVTGRHVKQSGGHGQYAVCHVEFEPLPRGSGFQFESRVVGGAVPTQYVPSVERGIRTQLERGLGEGDAQYPVVDVRAVLVDGKAHSVDSSDAAFQTAGALALREAAAVCGTVVLEPLDEIAVTVPDEFLGTVLGDLSSRRGRVLGTDAGGDVPAGYTCVRAEVPQTELLRYAVDLRSMTSGAATFTRTFARYEPMPT